MRFAGLILDLDAFTLARGSGETIPLTRAGFALLRFFVSHPGRVLSREALLEAMAGRRFEPFDRSVDVLIGRLRRKIEPDSKKPRLIVTVPGEGYRFDGLTKTFQSAPRAGRPPRTQPALSRQSQRNGSAPRSSGRAVTRAGASSHHRTRRRTRAISGRPVARRPRGPWRRHWRVPRLRLRRHHPTRRRDRRNARARDRRLFRSSGSAGKRRRTRRACSARDSAGCVRTERQQRR